MKRNMIAGVFALVATFSFTEATRVDSTELSKVLPGVKDTVQYLYQNTPQEFYGVEIVGTDNFCNLAKQALELILQTDAESQVHFGANYSFSSVLKNSIIYEVDFYDDSISGLYIGVPQKWEDNTTIVALIFVSREKFDRGSSDKQRVTALASTIVHESIHRNYDLVEVFHDSNLKVSLIQVFGTEDKELGARVGSGYFLRDVKRLRENYGFRY